jgi:cell wall-associated NlpC family hydrolase
MNLKKIVCLAVCTAAISIVFVNTTLAQKRERIVKSVSSQPTNQPPAAAPQNKVKPLSSSQPVNRPALETRIVVVGGGQNNESLIRKTASEKPVTAASTAPANKAVWYSSLTNQTLMNGIENRLGIPYLYGSTGPNRYDCSGFVWRVFQDAGINFTRGSVRNHWAEFETVYGDDRFKFGTLIFLNNLGHMGIVKDETGFYHASSSKGIMFSPFKGYWQNRIVGFKRVPAVGVGK